jgi:hypothetical protein
MVDVEVAAAEDMRSTEAAAVDAVLLAAVAELVG